MTCISHLEGSSKKIR